MIDEYQLSQPQTPRGLNHLVLRVRDLNESHAFWTEYLGFTHVGTTYGAKGTLSLSQTRYYSGRRNGLLSHHDIALAEDSRMKTSDLQLAIDHIAIEYASEESWRLQIEFLRRQNVTVRGCLRRGTTMSARVADPNGYTIELVCELPRELWGADINAALNKQPVSLDQRATMVEMPDAR